MQTFCSPTSHSFKKILSLYFKRFLVIQFYIVERKRVAKTKKDRNLGEKNITESSWARKSGGKSNPCQLSSQLWSSLIHGEGRGLPSPSEHYKHTKFKGADYQGLASKDILLSWVHLQFLLIRLLSKMFHFCCRSFSLCLIQMCIMDEIH